MEIRVQTSLKFYDKICVYNGKTIVCQCEKNKYQTW